MCLQPIPENDILLIKMSKNTPIILGDHFDKFIKKEIKKGRYQTASEVIRSGLRLLEIEKSKIEAINKALFVGEKSGTPLKFNNEDFKSKMKRKLNA